MKEHKNNFDFLRLFAASLVIISHNIGHYGGFRDPLKMINHSFGLGTTGVFIFFIISGYLITMSWLKSKNIINYFRNRVLRIFPALIVVLLFSIFIVGPLFTNLALSDYFTNLATYKYLINLSLIKLVNTLPGVFETNNYTATINPQIWTLVFEFIMYFIVAFYGIVGLFSKNKNVRLIYLILNCSIILIYSFISFDPTLKILKINFGPLIMFYSHFFAGSIFYLFKDKIKLNFWIVLATSIVWYFSIDTHFFYLMNLIFISSLVFYIAFLPYKIGYFITKTGDYSYGLYLFGSIVINIFQVLFLNQISLLFQIILTLVCTFPFAILSWHFIEKKAMLLKK